MNLGLKKVKSLFMQCITSDKLNNLGEDSFSTLMPLNKDGSIANIEKVAWLKGGSTYPKLYPYDTNFKTSGSKCIVADPNLTRDFINAVVDVNVARTLSIAPQNLNRSWVGKPTGTDITYQFINDSGLVWGLGVNYENYIGSAGIDLSREALGLAVDCKLESDNAQSLFLFVNAESSIVWNANGVQVIN
jgi:hypothetical protein